MKAYFATTGTLFALVTISHLLRTPEIVRESQTRPMQGILYTALTVVSAALSVWAWTLFARARRAV
jgi:hypothetical protein